MDTFQLRIDTHLVKICDAGVLLIAIHPLSSSVKMTLPSLVVI